MKTLDPRRPVGGPQTIRTLSLFAALLACACLMPALAAVEATDGWSRETVPGTTVGVGYFTLRNTGTGAARLMKITTPVAASVELHQSSIDAQGIAHMWPVASLTLNPGEVAHFAPGGKHLMLVGLNKPLRAGEKIAVTMQFDRDTPPVTAILTVRSLLSSTVEPASEHDKR